MFKFFQVLKMLMLLTLFVVAADLYWRSRSASHTYKRYHVSGVVGCDRDNAMVMSFSGTVEEDGQWTRLTRDDGRELHLSCPLMIFFDGPGGNN